MPARPDHALSTMTDENDRFYVAAAGGSSKFPLRRLVPLIVVLAASAIVFAMGWHRQLSFETLVRHHETLRAFIAEHETAAVAAYIALYIAAVALSIPVGFYLTVTGGILFGAVIGGAAAGRSAKAGGVWIFLIAESARGARALGPR